MSRCNPWEKWPPGYHCRAQSHSSAPGMLTEQWGSPWAGTWVWTPGDMWHVELIQGVELVPKRHHSVRRDLGGSGCDSVLERGERYQRGRVDFTDNRAGHCPEYFRRRHLRRSGVLLRQCQDYHHRWSAYICVDHRSDRRAGPGSSGVQILEETWRDERIQGDWQHRSLSRSFLGPGECGIFLRRGRDGGGSGGRGREPPEEYPKGSSAGVLAHPLLLCIRHPRDWSAGSV